MKYVILLLIISIIFIGCSAQPQNTIVKESELQCPKGLSNEPYPGSCPLYVDNNNDKHCDYG